MITFFVSHEKSKFHFHWDLCIWVVATCIRKDVVKNNNNDNKKPVCTALPLDLVSRKSGYAEDAKRQFSRCCLFWCLLPHPTPVGVPGYFTKRSTDKSWWGKEPLNVFLALGHSTISVPCSRSSDFGVLGSILEVSITSIRQQRSRDLVFAYLLLNPPVSNCIASFQMKYCDFLLQRNH